MVGLRKFARHTGLRRVRGEGAEGGDADEDERAEARSILLHLRLRRGIYKAHNAEPRTDAVEREEPCRKSFKDWISWTAVALEPCASRHPMISSGKEPGANTGITHAMQVTVYVHVWTLQGDSSSEFTAALGYGRVGLWGSEFTFIRAKVGVWGSGPSANERLVRLG